MRRYFGNREVAKQCHILTMLEEQAAKPHLSFHTPGHKLCGYDITELEYSDNLSCPRGIILRAEQDIAAILGAAASFILTDGSTAGVLSMLYALKRTGCTRVAAPVLSHKSFFNGCALLGLTPVLFETPQRAVPCPLTVADVEEALTEADALFITSPDYYGNVAELQGLRALCDGQGKPLIIDGAHGGHLHFDRKRYAGAYADLWVDGVHKSLPALTQGSVVSAREKYAAALKNGVDIFRTTSPSYPIMASVEYAVKYPQNKPLEGWVQRLKTQRAYLYDNEDYTKLCVFTANGFALEKEGIKRGIYPEFATENIVCFYLSPAQKEEDVQTLLAFLDEMSAEGRLLAEKDVKRIPAPTKLYNIEGCEVVKVPLQQASGRICARVCGVFPPCVPLIRTGEPITAEKLRALAEAANVFGVENGEIWVVKKE